ncbi:hypothetical protein P280DRAFT_394369 [Massarina eburnea CBS 473.64]|uniref:Alpha/beta-hydrolase n=1 Tax=Massarina eburnea CBS 473.64 TaxID=1395130 RepID=A0A6A6S913_9PLEO|nr:hypothetical protein P280DRAFT_394369 [Massarina eburnea CBS 473.64]
MPRTPEPRFTCTIPSICDDLPLNVRIYHPECLSRPTSKNYVAGMDDGGDSEDHWPKKGIIMAHPYAPMGGSYDDRVVGIVLDEFLGKGWIVCTFNFRGAHGSKGRTSWSGKPELDDYISSAAFFIHYLSYLRPDPPPTAVFTPEQSPVLSEARKQQDATSTSALAEGSPIVVLGGYSYGSLILKHMPPIPTILHPFSAPLAGSAVDEILLRAYKLADRANLEWINQARDFERRQKKRQKAQEHKLSVMMGGEETSPEKRRSSRDIRLSMDGGGRRSLDIGNTLRSLSHRRSANPSPSTQTPPKTTAPKRMISMPQVRYLLISPLTPPISALAAPSLVPKFWSKPSDGASGDVISKHTTLVIFGDQDIFGSVKKVRDWTGGIQSESGSRFHGVEVEGAGHFWHEEGVERELRDALIQWEARVKGRSII